ncbi:MAG TPA: thioredoxin-like domain-containing protein [Pyrinomonadaceae bacterium]|nr:thioredoxin-like domain-containing protein [Pyrinomonadaceae bacterium]
MSKQRSSGIHQARFRSLALSFLIVPALGGTVSLNARVRSQYHHAVAGGSVFIGGDLGNGETHPLPRGGTDFLPPTFSLSLGRGSANHAQPDNGSVRSKPPRGSWWVNHTKGKVMSQERARVRAPELTGGRGWLNTDKPLSLAALKGKIVLLDFWTYGCINCIHIIPDLKKLEAKYANELVVIGVHSAKFANEKETENIRRIILRYEIEHPIYNDADFVVWRSYGVRAWPTQVLIDPAGYVIGAVSGEANYDLIDQVIAKAADDFRKRGELKEEPLKLTLERAKVADLPLAFPGKVLADAKGNRLFIADSNHNRLVITRLDGTLLETIGTGAPGAADGPFEKATFYRPQGMALEADKLYVADTENHLIRLLDLKRRTVQTFAGTGKQSHDYFQTGPAQSIGLNSPWDLELVGRILYIAMAGPHQIWKLDLDKQEISTFAGSGREARMDGPVLEAGFAQPSGITSDGHSLFIADSESNIIRAIDLASGVVKTLVGGDLFEFGDTDGEGDDVRLQHPLGVFALDGRVFIADTYNHKIKELHAAKAKVRTFQGAGKPGQVDGLAASFYEPGGLSIANDKIYVADTNNHAVRVVDLKTRETSTLRIKDLQAPSVIQYDAVAIDDPNAEKVITSVQRARAGSDGFVVVNVALPSGYHLNPAAPQRYRLSIESGPQQLALQPDPQSGAAANAKVVSHSGKDLQLPLRIPFRTLTPGKAELRVQLTLFYCREDNTGTCRIKTLIWQAPVEVSSDSSAPTEIRLQGNITL